jgi:hypothetical protein
MASRSQMRCYLTYTSSSLFDTGSNVDEQLPPGDPMYTATRYAGVVHVHLVEMHGHSLVSRRGKERRHWQDVDGQ